MLCMVAARKLQTCVKDSSNRCRYNSLLRLNGLLSVITWAALLRVQTQFVEQLYNSGMVDELEKEALLEPIEKNERRLVRTGALNLSHRIDEVRPSQFISLGFSMPNASTRSATQEMYYQRCA